MLKNFNRCLVSLLAVLILLAPAVPAAGAAAAPGPAPRPETPGGALSLEAAGIPLPPPVELRYDPQAVPFSVPAPAAPAALRPQAATFAVDYVPAGGKNSRNTTCQAFPPEAQTAFNAAAAIWSNLLTSPVPIRIEACWAPLGAGILGSSGALGYYRGTSGSTWDPQVNTFYPSALANALQGFDINPSRDDMSIVFSSDYAPNFYFGAGPVPSNKIDFTSVVLHEIGHGLGFAGLMLLCSGNGLWGYLSCPPSGSAYPGSYDHFTVDGAGRGLIDPLNYANNSASLGAALQSNNVYFNGANAKAANGGGLVKLYAPSSWTAGSSYAHLDDNTFRGSPNALMIHAIGNGQSIHSPGPVGLGVLKDVGWAPFAPGNLLAGSSAPGKASLTWTNNSRNAAGFKIERSPDGTSGWQQIGTAGPGASAYTDNSMPVGANYYRVRAYTALGDSLYSNTASIIPSLNPPLALAAGGAPTTTQIVLNWQDTNTKETGYKVEHSATGAAPWTPDCTTAADVTTCTVPGLAEGTLYSFRVWAFNAQETSAAAAFSLATALSAPTDLKAELTPANQISLTWINPSPAAPTFEVQRSPDGVTAWATVGTTPDSTPAYSDGAGLAENTTYSYRVRAVKPAIGSTSPYTVLDVKPATQLFAPTGLTAVATLPTRIDLRWTDNSLLATGIELQRSPDGETWSDLPSLPATAAAYSDDGGAPGLAPNKFYYYRLRATGAATLNSLYTLPVRAFTGANRVYLAVMFK